MSDASSRRAESPGSATGARKTVNLALQGGGSHGAYTWGAIDALIDDERIEIGGISGASAGAMNAVVYADGFRENGRAGAKRKLNDFWLSVSEEGALSPMQRRIVDLWFKGWGLTFPQAGALWDVLSQFASPYEFNPLNLSPLRDHLVKLVDFEALRREGTIPLFVAATNVRTGRGEIFRSDVLNADHLMASACLPRLFQAVEIDGVPYWDGGFAGNPPLWPLYYETSCQDAVIVQINPIERQRTPHSAQEIADRMNEITFNAGLLAELRATDFVARLIEGGNLRENGYRRQRVHRIGGDGDLADFGAASKMDVRWTFLLELRDLGREAAKTWLARHFDEIGVRSTLDLDRTLAKPQSAG
ncbi:MAG: patatin-like phospholipase family protein [Hyphomicrobiales bacterium]|nr:patatin-like phospholipase family protein [Hyphomicrobiales bacterium]